MILLTEIFVNVLRSAIFLDVGVGFGHNLLNQPERMRQVFQQNLGSISRLNTTRTPDIYFANLVLQNMTDYGVPLDEPHPVQFGAQYLCDRLKWKEPSNLILDVLVATVSLFLGYWAMLNFILRFLATRSAHGTSLTSF